MHKINVSPHAGIIGKYANRHGLIAGATGTGKTVTLQTLCEGFSKAGVPVFVADVKGDIAGLAISGTEKACPAKFWDVYGEQGAPMRLTLDAIGPDLLARMLELTDAQKGLVESAYGQTELRMLRDLMKAVPTGQCGASYHVLNRALNRFERQGGNALIGADCFDIAKLFDKQEGQGVINILAAERLIHNPQAYSTLMLWLLTELFERMPEAGDLALPRLVLFIDEAHLLFSDAPDHLLRKIEQTVRLIRSKGVGIYFVTQSPDDLPFSVLGQLGNRVQHALRGATARDQRAIRAAAETMPINPNIDAAEAIGRLGIGCALVSFIREDGTPSPVQMTKITLPGCRLGPITSYERMKAQLRNSGNPYEEMAKEYEGVEYSPHLKELHDRLNPPGKPEPTWTDALIGYGTAAILIGPFVYMMFN